MMFHVFQIEKFRGKPSNCEFHVLDQMTLGLETVYDTLNRNMMVFRHSSDNPIIAQHHEGK
jgi:hypothetical protein